MPRRLPARAIVMIVTLSALTAGCQDYNFNPVGQCVIQPGAERVALSNISTADVLFVVDDSGSMAQEQEALADNFNRFITNLRETNEARQTGGQEPFDFHIAVTTSSVFWNEVEFSQTCSNTCGAAAGQLVCCIGNTTPALQPRRCSSDSQCGGLGSGVACRTTCTGFKGEGYCCAGDGTFPASAIADVIPCSRAGTQCGRLQTHYDYRGSCVTSSVDQGIAPGETGWPYPRGDFVGLGGNPRVLHFDKRLYREGTNAQGFDAATLESFFQQNIKVGVCGSGQEQSLQASRLAIQKALSGQQRDTWSFDPKAAGTAVQSWNPVTREAGSVARWPNPKSKLVLVFVGDEDDCSSPQDPSGGVVMFGEAPGADACSRDATEALPVGRKQFPVAEFADYFTSLGRPVAAGFIFPAAQTTCTLQSCTTDGLCGDAQASGFRLLATAKALAAKGVEVVAGSICDPDFGALLEEIAEIVKPPQTLTLPTEPAEGDITVLRILSPNGQLRKLCGRPLMQSGLTLAQAQDTGADWWFTQTASPGTGTDGGGPVPVSRFVYINPRGACRANPGETYSADYMGLVPASGCSTDLECTEKLGGKEGDFECFTPPGLLRGTCTCKSSL